MTGRSPPRRLSLQHKLPLMIALLFVALGVAGAVMAYAEVRNSAIEGAREHLERATLQLADLMDAAVRARLDGMAAAADEPDVIAALSAPTPPAETDPPRSLVRLAELEGTVFVELWRPSGEAVSAVGDLPEGWSGEDLERLRAAAGNGGGPGYSEIMTVGDANYVWVLHPVARGGDEIGTVAQLRPIGAYAASSQVRNLIGSGVQIYFVNTGGGTWFTLAGDVQDPLLQDLPFTPRIYSHPDGQAFLGYAAPAGSAGFTILGEVPMAEVLGRAHALAGRMAGVGLLLVLLATFGAFWISRSIVLPLQRLRAAAGGIAAGDYSRRAGVDRPDELGDLARSFDEMASGIEAAQRELEERYGELQTLTRKLEENNRALEVSVALTEEARASAEEANRAKSDFVAAVSHEIRTPLNSVVGYAELLRMGVRGPLAEEQREPVEKILAGSRIVAGLLDDLLDLARVESGKMELEMEVERVGDLVEDALGIVLPDAERKGIRLDVSLEDPDAWIEADPKRVRQILLNLFSNAVKFTDEGGRIEVDVSSPKERVGGVTCITVKDTGLGIPPEERERIFEPFVRGRNGAGATGVGLGLAISRRIARLMGGEITLRSRIGKGSAFSLQLPGPADAEVPPRVPAHSVTVPSGADRRLGRPRRRRDREQH